SENWHECDRQCTDVELSAILAVGDAEAAAEIDSPAAQACTCLDLTRDPEGVLHPFHDARRLEALAAGVDVNALKAQGVVIGENCPRHVADLFFVDTELDRSPTHLQTERAVWDLGIHADDNVRLCAEPPGDVHTLHKLAPGLDADAADAILEDRKSTRLNSSH